MSHYTSPYLFCTQLTISLIIVVFLLLQRLGQLQMFDVDSLFCQTLCAALQSLTWTPRLLAAIANDDILPVAICCNFIHCIHVYCLCGYQKLGFDYAYYHNVFPSIVCWCESVMLSA
jgi:hypothetical protein